jgi:peptidoglycan-associated lipoprotein
MKKQIIQILGLGLVLTVGSVGCKHNKPSVTPLPNGGPGGISGNDQIDNGLKPGAGTEGSTQGNEIPTTGIGQTRGHEGWDKNPDMFKGDTVHFDYDSSVVKSGDKPKISTVAEYLKSNSSAAVEVDGHCDERGTDEYNRALGERRALAVRESLVADGVDASRVETVSFGRDRPVDTGRGEAAHAKNRRGEFVLLTPPGAKQ